MILNTSEAEGGLYVETKNLDGETNLKLKSVHKDLIRPFVTDTAFGNMAGTLNIEMPNNRIYKFDGNYEVPNGGSNLVVPLSNDNVALRGMSLRNTEYVKGIVVYTGHDSKIQMNSAGATHKSSNIMRTTNKMILIVFCIQVICSIIGSTIGTTWMINNLKEAKYLGFATKDDWNSNWGLLFIKTTGTWILIFT